MAARCVLLPLESYQAQLVNLEEALLLPEKEFLPPATDNSQRLACDQHEVDALPYHTAKPQEHGCHSERKVSDM